MTIPHKPHSPALFRFRHLAPITTSLLAALLVGCGTPVPKGPTHKLQEVRYLCADDMVLEVSYLKQPGGESYASFPFQGHMAVLQSRTMATGVRYVDQNEQQGLRWTIQGGEGFLSIQAPDHTASEKTLLTRCRATPAR
jgi:membrane-bound inhibitor of C-type lysozyme